jgi:hypothetical protein
MKRRDFNRCFAPLIAATGFTPQLSATSQQTTANTDHIYNSVPQGPPQQIAMLAYPRMTALDLIGPQTFLAGLGNVEVHLVWKSRELIATDNGLQLLPSKSFEECPRDLDILFVPGGSKGTIALMNDQDVIGFLADRGARAKIRHKCLYWLDPACICRAVARLQGYLSLSCATASSSARRRAWFRPRRRGPEPHHGGRSYRRHRLRPRSHCSPARSELCANATARI